MRGPAGGDCGGARLCEEVAGVPATSRTNKEEAAAALAAEGRCGSFAAALGRCFSIAAPTPPRQIVSYLPSPLTEGPGKGEAGKTKF